MAVRGEAEGHAAGHAGEGVRAGVHSRVRCHCTLLTDCSGLRSRHAGTPLRELLLRNSVFCYAMPGTSLAYLLCDAGTVLARA